MRSKGAVLIGFPIRIISLVFLTFLDSLDFSYSFDWFLSSEFMEFGQVSALVFLLFSNIEGC